MRLCIFTENYLKGGLDTFMVNLINHFPESVQITLMCNKNHKNIGYLRNSLPPTVEIVEYGFLTNYVIAWRLGTGAPERLITLVQFLEYFLRYTILLPIYFIKLVLTFQKYHFESLLVVNGGYPGGILARIACIAFKFINKTGRCVLNVHNDVVKAKFVILLQEYILDKLVQKAVDVIVFPSEATKDTLNNRKHLMDLPKIVVPNGIRSRALKGRLKSDRLNKTIVMAGTLEERKGHVLALEASSLLLREVSDFSLHIFGEGTVMQEENIRSKIQELGLQKNVFLRGFTENVLDELAKATVVIMPSQEAEAFGLVLIEAMSVATPVICTKVGGMPEVVEQGQTGIMIEKHDAIALANALRKVLTDNEYARQLGENGMMFQQRKFDVKSMSKHYYSIIKSCE